MARIRCVTYGCTHNRADSERMAGLLVAAGHEMVEREEDAELLILNSCAVKDPAEQRFRDRLRRTTLPVVIAGCVPQGSPRDPTLQGFSAVGTKAIDRIVDVVEATLRGEVRREMERKEDPSLLLPRIRRNPFVAIIPVASGCLDGCAYCKTVHARGRLESRSVAEVLEAIRLAVSDGAKEVWLTAEDVGAYGRDIGESLGSLLEAVAELRGAFMVRVGMANPHHVARELDRILSLLARRPDRFFRFLHLPVQSGSDQVLAAMGRRYDAALFERIVATATRSLPGITIMTDCIVGYPGEKEEEFGETLALLERTRCRLVNITRFYARPGTRAARLKQLPSTVVAERCRRLVALFEADDPNEGMVGETVEALLTERGKEGSVVGHTRSYVQVVVPSACLNRGGEEPLGRWHRLRVTQENKYRLLCEPVGEGPEQEADR